MKFLSYQKFSQTLFFLFFPLLLSAQATETVHIKFQMVCLERSITALKYKNGGEAIDISIPNASFSNIYQYKGPPKLNFYTEQEKPDGSKEEISIQSINMPLETDGMTLLFLVDINTSNSKKPINFTVFSKEKNLSNPNTVIVINQAKEPIRIYAGGSDLKIKTGSMDKAIVKTNKKGSFPLTIYKIIDEEPIKAFHSFFRSKKGQSLFLFVSPNKKDVSRLNVHQIAYRDPNLTDNSADQIEETLEPEIKRKKSLSEEEIKILKLK